MKLKEFTELMEKISKNHDVRESTDDYNSYHVMCKNTMVILHYMSEQIELPISVRIVNPDNEPVFISFIDKIEYYWVTEKIILVTKGAVSGVIEL